MNMEERSDCRGCKLVRFVAPNGRSFCLPPNRAGKFLTLQNYPGESKHATVPNCDRSGGKVKIIETDSEIEVTSY